MSFYRPAWLAPPVFPDRDRTAVAHNVYILCAICIPCLVVTAIRNWFTALPMVFYELAGETLFVCAVYAINRRGHVRLAATLLTSSLVALTTMLLFTAGDGSHDIAILVYPCALVLAALLLEWRWLALVTLLALAGSAAVVGAEISGLLVSKFSSHTRWGDLMDMAVILTGTSAILGVWATQFRASIARARQSQEAMEQSNRELAAQAGQLANTARDLRESEARHRAILASSIDGLIVTDAAGRVVDFNPAAERIFGYARADVIGREVADLIVPPALRDKHRNGLSRYLETRQATLMGRPVEMPAVRADGQEFRIELTIANVPGIEPPLFAGVVRDITERIQLEAQLRQAQKMQAVGQLAGGVAHDFNNQLTSVMGFADMLAARLTDPEDQRFAGHILQASRRAADLTQKLLAFSRKGKFIAMPVDLHQIIVEVAALLRHSLDKRIEIRQQFEAPRSVTRGDPNQLQNAFLNLAINARDAMPDGGQLIFTTAVVEVREKAVALGLPAGSYLTVTVRDTGTGMDDETRKRLFEPFFTTKTEGKGTGLGLAAVYGTVKNHHGAIHVETEFGHGTAFTVYLPLLEDAAAPVLDEAVFTPTRPREARVLIVDDEESVRLLVAEVLRRHGCLTMEFDSGPAAVEYYQRFRQDVDLVILDLVMPKMGGRETFAALRKINPQVKALLVSGFSLDGEAQTVLNEGVLGFLQKPFSQAELLQAVDEALKRRVTV